MIFGNGAFWLLKEGVSVCEIVCLCVSVCMSFLSLCGCLYMCVVGLSNVDGSIGMPISHPT